MSQTSDDTRAPQSLHGQVALVTGGARRIGAAIVSLLHAGGMNVVIHHHRSSREAAALAEALNARRVGSAATASADLTDPAARDGLLHSTTDAFGRLDLLVNNASSFYPTPVGTISEDNWNDVMGTNLKAPLFLAQAAHPWLKKSSGGCIVNIADIHGQRPLRDHPVYCAAKAGLIMLTLALARDMGPLVRVNAISPGPILWPEADAGNEADQAAILERTALGRLGSPSDIARAVLFLFRDAPYVTGQNIAVDGGRSLNQ